MRKNLLKYSICLLIALIFFTGKTAIGQAYFFKQISLKDGLPQSHINKIKQDPYGYLWFATDVGGVARYNGKTFEVWDVTNGLAGNSVTDLAFDSLNNVFIGTKFYGLSMLNRNSLINFNVKNGLLNNSIVDLEYNLHHKMLFIAHPEALSSFDYQTFQSIDKDYFKQNKIKINDLLLYGDQQLLIATDTGVFIYHIDEKKMEFLDLTGEINGARITQAEKDKNNNVFLVKNNQKIYVIQASCFKTKNFKVLPYQKINLPQMAKITTIHITYDNELWVGTDNNLLYRIRGEKIETFSEQNGFKAKTVTSILKGIFGITWIGTAGEGIFKFYTSAFVQYNMKNKTINDIFGIAEWNGNIYAASRFYGILQLKNGYLEPYITNKDVLNARTITFDHEGKLWIATPQGLYSYTRNNLKKYGPENGLQATNIRSLLVDKDGVLWVGTGEQGLYVWRNGKFEMFDPGNNEINKFYIHEIYQDSNGVIWLGTNVGVFKLVGNDFVKLYDSNQFCSTFVGDIAENKNKHLFFASVNCVIKYDGVDFTKIDYNQIPSLSTVYFVQSDAQGDIWIGTNEGVTEVKFNQYGDIVAYSSYGLSQGFVGQETNARASLLSSNGELYFGTIDGLMKVDPRENLQEKVPPRIYLVQIQKNFLPLFGSKDNEMFLNQWIVDPSQIIKFQKERSHYTFVFDLVHSGFAENALFSFKLEGFDPDFSPFSKENKITYSNLPPGKYKLICKAFVPEQGLYVDSRPYEIIVLAPFWMQQWFYLILAFVLIAGLVYYDYLKKKKEAKLREEFERYAREKNKQILQQNEEIKLLLKEVHHRVKNNLQLIISLLNIQMNYVKDPAMKKLLQESSARIRAMSLLHEKIYKTQRFDNIDIKNYFEELIPTIVDNYALSTEVNLNMEIDPVMMHIDKLIPLGLIATELVTNSIVHGFRNRLTGNITIKFKKLENKQPYAFEFLVADDGVGMDPSIVQQNNHSMGIELVKLLTEQLSGELHIESGENGTIFKIKIPNYES